MRVARIIARLNIGGPAIQALLLTEDLARPRFSTLLITGTVGESEGDFTPVARRKNIAMEEIPELRRDISLRKDLVAFWKLLRILRSFRPQIVHTHTAKAGFLGRFAAIAAGVPIRVHTFHGHVFHDYFSSLKTKLFLLLERWLARATHCIIAVSETQKEELADRYHIAARKKFRVIPLGFDLTPFSAVGGGESVMRRPEADSHDFVIGFIGRLVPVKNPLFLLDAFERLKTRFHSAPDSSQRALADRMRLLVVGGGELEPGLRAWTLERGLEKVISFAGWRKRMEEIYPNLDAVALPSKNEGTPVVLIEAMAAGKPFVATDVGGVRDLMVGSGRTQSGEQGGQFTVYGNGILVACDDMEGLVSALAYLAADGKQRAQMGQIGRSFALQQFDKQRLLLDVEGLYDELIGEGGRQFALAQS